MRKLRFKVTLARVRDGVALRERPAVLELSVPRRKLNGSRGKTHDARVVAGKLASVRTLSLKSARKFQRGESVPFWFRGHEHALTRAQ